MLYYQRVAGQPNSAPAPFFCPTALVADVCAIAVTRSLVPTPQTTFSLTLSGLESYVYYSANVCYDSMHVSLFVLPISHLS